MFSDIAWAAAAVALVIGYVLGSIPFGLLLTRLAGLGDVRAIGSGNIGATNVLRTGRRGLALATFLADALKGTAAVLVVAAIWDWDAARFAALGAVLGHLFPVWLGFRGGKGVATYVGVLLAIYWPGVLVFAAIWIGIAYATRYSSLAALVATLAVPVLLAAIGRGADAELFVILTLGVWIMHHANIRRLIAGSEGKIGRRA